jgi:two-component system OmpR family response regulator
MSDRIAVIDDDDDTRQLVEDVLTATGFEVYAMADFAGLPADPNKSFKLIITDTLRLPYDQAVVAAFIRDVKRDHACPILLLTGHVLPEEEAAILGVDHVMNKPYLIEDLVRKVRTILESPERRREPRK